MTTRHGEDTTQTTIIPPPQIQHCGDVLIRGRIRRIWRPRRLELMSDGLLRFFDAQSLKYTLSVQSSRILDTLTIRDMHTGLPRGTYGFLIRGQRIATDEILNAPSFEVVPLLMGAGEDTSASSPHFSTNRGFKESFVLAEAPEPQPVRDYLCAVETLEQAQMWVVALQWAANHVQEQSGGEEEHWWKIDYSPRPSIQPEETPPAPPAKPTTTIVTKVSNYSFVRTAFMEISIVYEIHVLSLLVDPTSDTSPVTEWKVYKTKQELVGISSDAHRLLQTLPDTLFQRDILWNPLAKLESSVSVVDSVLRSFSLAEDTVGALATTLQRSSKTLQRHHHTIDSNAIDAYVRNWLQERRQKEPARQQQWMYMGGALVAFVGLPALRTAWSCSRYIVPMRVDCLMLSWAGAVYLGYRYGANTHKTKSSQPESLHPPLVSKEEVDDEESEGEATDEAFGKTIHDIDDNHLSSPLPCYPDNGGTSCWSQPPHNIFHVRGSNYFKDKVKIPSNAAPLECLGVDFWLTENPERHIARHPDVLGGRVAEQDTLVVNFLLPFANFVAYFKIPPLNTFPDKLRSVWTKFVKGDQQYRDARLKLLPVVVEGPWIVKTAVGPGKSPALLGKVIPLQYFFQEPAKDRRGMYEIDIIITASSIAKGILSVVKSQTKSVTIAFALIIEAAEQNELPENILCSFQVHSLHLEECPSLRCLNLDDCSK